MYTYLYARPVIKIEAPKVVTHVVYELDTESLPTNLSIFATDVYRYFPGLPNPVSDLDEFQNQKFAKKNNEIVYMEQHTRFFAFTFMGKSQQTGKTRHEAN